MSHDKLLYTIHVQLLKSRPYLSDWPSYIWLYRERFRFNLIVSSLSVQFALCGRFDQHQKSIRSILVKNVTHFSKQNHVLSYKSGRSLFSVFNGIQLYLNGLDCKLSLAGYTMRKRYYM